MSLVRTARAESPPDFALVNKTGYDLTAAKWDIKVVYEVNDSSVEWKGCKPKEVNKLTLRDGRVGTAPGPR